MGWLGGDRACSFTHALDERLSVTCRIQRCSTRENEIGEAKNTPVAVHVLPDLLLQLLSYYDGPLVIGIVQQPLESPCSPGAFEVIPFAQVRRAQVDDTPLGRHGRCNQPAERQDPLAAERSGAIARGTLPIFDTNKEPSAGADNPTERLQRLGAATPRVGSSNAENTISRRTPGRDVAGDKGDALGQTTQGCRVTTPERATAAGPRRKEVSRPFPGQIR